MGIEGWTIFWALVLLTGCLLFLGLAVVVTAGGLRDVRAMFRSMSEQHGGASRKGAKTQRKSAKGWGTGNGS